MKRKAEQGAPSARFTPGPWEQTPDRNEQINIYGPDHLWIALLPHQCVTRIEKQQKINAALLVAAPDLYEALVEALREADECRPRKSPEAGIIPRPHFMWREKARAALAKADGRGASNG